MGQYFKCGDQIECIDVRQDAHGQFFSQLDDIQDIFHGAARFRVDGKTILFLQDEHGQRHVPYRIGYYPRKVVEVIIADSTTASAHGTETLSSDSKTNVCISTGAPLSNLHGSRSTALVLATPQSSILNQYQRRDSALVPALLQTSASITQQITQLKQQLAQSTHIQLNAQESHQAAQMAKLMELVQLLAESKARDEETQRMIRQVNDHIVIVRQKVDAILVQNYELHEYPIPRLFVVLPVTEAEHSKADSGEHGEQIDNTTHLALHEGYELTRPTVFFERYGPYLLGMLQILKVCLLAAATVVPPVRGLTPAVDQLSSTVRSKAENTVRAVEYSIQFLEAKLNKTGSDAKSTTSTAAIDGGGFKNLQALEGADLRKLDTFLKNKDNDKILGNLYRITTKEGHVKWVCLNHYRSSYREAAMKSFLQVVELNQGEYDPQLRKATVQLHSAITAREFFTQLERAPAVNEIDIEFNWEFSPSDLKQIVRDILKSNIRFCTLSLNDNKDRDYNERLLGRGRYDSLMELLSATKIQSVHFTGMSLLGKRSSNFAKGTVCSSLTRFEYANTIRIEDQARLVNILQACLLLVALRLGDPEAHSVLAPVLACAIMQLQNLEVLQLLNCKSESGGTIYNFLGAFPKSQKLRELVISGGWYDLDELHKLIRSMEPFLERLHVGMGDRIGFNNGLDFKRLLPKDYGHRKKVGGSTNLTPFKNVVNLAVSMNAVSAQVLQCIGGMSLKEIFLDCAKPEWAIIHHIDFSSLRPDAGSL
ncbi:hypothetical protein BGZ74_010997 [Mortierella antarctica]|nr:hypothetical protein BGZ74_010997 [Mortierella antarctica]